ncbi:MAG: GyrI-like domain-containing protein [Bacteroidota bacterium]
MNSRIEQLQQKQLLGVHLPMTFANNRTGELWRSFMQRRNEIHHRATADLISMQVYNEQMDFNNMDPHVEFEKWATAEVTDISNIPEGMELFILPGGLYAVFDYKGTPQGAEPFFRYIFGTWLPASGYVLDKRPHFEILGAKYKNNDPDSEEEIWIPIKQKV